jgi:predicted nucleic acid-binding protein
VKIALDTNILVYAEGVDDLERRDAALDLIRRLSGSSVVVPVQVLGELFAVLVRKARWPREDARAALIAWHDAFPVVETSGDIVLDAADAATAHRLSLWDALILVAAGRGGCRLLLSEDLQDGFTWGGVTVANPFAPAPHPLLSAVLGPDRNGSS